MKRAACIITGGTVAESLLKEWLEKKVYAVVIAVDGGLAVAHRLAVIPDYIVGDFDTVSANLLEQYEEKRILRHPPEKDETDTELAIETAIREGCTKIDFFGATGSRLDHSLANIFLLERLLSSGIEGAVLNDSNKLYLKDSSFQIKKKEVYGDFFSLLPLSKTVERVTLTGFKYPVNNRTFHRECTLGISNEIIDEEASVEFAEGIFIVVESRD